MSLPHARYIFRPPHDQTVIDQLKLAKTNAEVAVARHPWETPIQMMFEWAIIRMADELLTGTTVNTRRMAEKFQDRFGHLDPVEFCQACRAIERLYHGGGLRLVRP